MENSKIVWVDDTFLDDTLMKILTKEVWHSNNILKMTLMMKILMTKLTMPFSLYVIFTDNKEYEKQF